MKFRLPYNRLKFSLTLGVALVFSGALHAQTSLELIYKKIDSTELKMIVDYPPGYQGGQSYPTLLFFFGGGWNNGSVAQFEPQARYFASRGMICVRADYRVKNHFKDTVLKTDDFLQSLGHLQGEATLSQFLSLE